MHPGPINRGIEIDDSVVDSPNAIINEQVTNGVAVRMAIFYLLAGGAPLEEMNETERMKILIKNGRLIDPATGQTESPTCSSRTSLQESIAASPCPTITT